LMPLRTVARVGEKPSSPSGTGQGSPGGYVPPRRRSAHRRSPGQFPPASRAGRHARASRVYLSTSAFSTLSVMSILELK
jgi:hypothetical protein